MSSSDPGRTALLPEEAIGLVVRDIPAVRTEKTALSLCAGRVLSGSLPNLIDQPPFDKSGMDGYAFCPYAAEPGRIVVLQGAFPEVRPRGIGKAEPSTAWSPPSLQARAEIRPSRRVNAHAS